jgi:hypothetical protein
LLHEGQVIALDDPSALRAAMPGLLLEVIVDARRPPVDILASLPGVEDVQVFGDGAHVRLGGPGLVAAFKDAIVGRGLRPVSIRPVPASLEDVFIDLVARGATGPSALRSQEVER